MGVADKYMVRNFMKNRGLENILVKLFGKYDTTDEINFDELPNFFVLKTNHGSGDCIVVMSPSLLVGQF